MAQIKLSDLRRLIRETIEEMNVVPSTEQPDDPMSRYKSSLRLFVQDVHELQQRVRLYYPDSPVISDVESFMEATSELESASEVSRGYGQNQSRSWPPQRWMRSMLIKKLQEMLKTFLMYEYDELKDILKRLGDSLVMLRKENSADKGVIESKT